MAEIRPKQAAVIETTEAQIAVHWREEEYYYPSSKFIGQANLTDPDVLKRFSEDNFPECFREYADMLSWDQYWHTTLDTNDPPFWKWFVGGKLNASYNCVDRHLEKYKNKAALIFVPEPENDATVTVTYRELYVRVNEFAALLRDFCGLKSGDRVTIHMPMVPELPITMLACARLGVVHSVVFGGFSGEACGTRAADSTSNVLITMDGYYRAGKMLDHKASAEIAVETSRQGRPQSSEGAGITPAALERRVAAARPFVKGGAIFGSMKFCRSILARSCRRFHSTPSIRCFSCSHERQHRQAKRMPASHGRLSRLRDRDHKVRSGSASRRRVLAHTKHPAGLRKALIHRLWPARARDATSVMYEGVPNYPDPGRPWRIAERLDVNIFHTSPTAIRMLAKNWPRRARQIQLPLQAHADQTVGEKIDRTRKSGAGITRLSANAKP